MAGYWPSPWPGEDGGPARLQVPVGLPGIGAAGGRLAAASRQAPGSSMVVLREPGEVYLHRHTVGPDCVTWIERVDPASLECVERSPELAGGPFWAGGIAVHANGSLYIVFGNHCHRLAPDCSPVSSRELPQPRAYNSFVILPDGHLVMKDIVRDGSVESNLIVLDPSTLEPLGAEVRAPEPSIARLSADGDDVYLIGDHTAFRYRWDGTSLVWDDDWRFRYRTLPGQTYAWDAVVALGAVWFMDQGDWRLGPTLRGAGIGEGPVHLVRVPTDDASAGTLAPVSGLPHGAITNPPVVDEARRIVVAYDSGNGVMRAWRVGEGLDELWRREQSHASHMVLFAESGELVSCDHHDGSDDVVVLDVSTGAELARVPVGSPAQSFFFCSPGWDRDAYYCSLTTFARVYKEEP